MPKRLLVSVALIVILAITITNQDINSSEIILSDINNDIVLVNTHLLLSSGTQINLDKVHEKDYLLINIWASWCDPCIKEVPDLIKLSRAPNLTILGLNVNDTEVAAKDFIDDLKINYPVVVKKEDVSKIISQFSWAGIPTSVLIDKEKRIVSTIYGEVKEKDILSLLNSLSN